jgi:lysophospholipase L1-like esterase
MKKRILQSVIAVTIVLALFETGLRSAGFHAPAPVLDYRLRISGELHGEPDRRRFWKLPNRRPNFSGDALKIICLADSVTVMDKGHGYPELLPAAFEKAGYTQGVEVFNAGVPEYTVFQGRIYLQNELIQYKPDIVTAQFGVNDHWRAPGGVSDPYVQMPGEKAMRTHRFLMNSRTYQALRFAVMRGPRSSKPKPWRVDARDYVENLGQIIMLCADNNIRLILILSPYLDIGQDWAPLHRRYIRLTQSIAGKNNTPVVDLIDRFRFDASLFMDPETDHIHFNSDGAKIIAEKIAEAAIK